MPEVLRNSFFLSGFFPSLPSTPFDQFSNALARESISILSAMVCPPMGVKKLVKNISRDRGLSTLFGESKRNKKARFRGGNELFL
jgi:hypothetical protein